MKEPIYVAGYPKSGTTWLTRLLAQATDSPSGASIPAQDMREPATEGLDRSGPYIVRKGHYSLQQGDGRTAVTGAHRIDANAEFTAVFLIRDPRSVAVSIHHYKGLTIDQTLHGMVTGGLFGLPPWKAYVQAWRALYLERSRIHIVRYEDLLRHTAFVLTNLLIDMRIAPDLDRVRQAVADQSMQVKRDRVMAHGDQMIGGRDLNLKLLRRGLPDEWREVMTAKQVQYSRQSWGCLLHSFGYASILL